MEYRILPRTGWKVSAISFGCMSLNREKGAGTKDEGRGARSTEHGAGSIDQGANERLLHKAVDLGINYFDTADIYDKGQNEIMVGKALSARRKELFIATKVGNQLRPDGSGWDWNPRKEYILKAVEGSLKRLQTDYIDLYQLHGGTIDDPIDETIEAFEILKQQGKIRAYGISSIRPNVIREFVKRSNIVSVMMQYSLLDRRPEETILPLLEENNIGVMVRGAVAKGLLVDKPAKEYLEYNDQQVARAAAEVREVTGYRLQDIGCRGEGRGTREEGAVSAPVNRGTPAQTSIQFTLKGPAVCTVVAGMRTEDQLNENASAPEAEKLTEPQYQQLLTLLTPNKYTVHR
jgi:aryl-alcohol dehydrogenase-like predicted oxidoreductase